MVYAYLDASALIKRYSVEAGSDRVNELFLGIARDHLVCSMLGVAEVTSILVQHNINATDAIILRSALDLQHMLQDAGDTLLFCAADKRLLRAAEGEGLNVLNPEEATAEDVQRLLGSALAS